MSLGIFKTSFHRRYIVASLRPFDQIETDTFLGLQYVTRRWDECMRKYIAEESCNKNKAQT